MNTTVIISDTKIRDQSNVRIVRSELSSLFIYQDEHIVTEAFKKYRIAEGISCKKCGSFDHYWLMQKVQFQCKKCKFRTTLRSGSVMENSKLPISYLFIACHLLLKAGNKLTTEELQHFTGHKYFEPLWSLLRKIKEEMSVFQQSKLLLYFIEEKQNQSIFQTL